MDLVFICIDCLRSDHLFGDHAVIPNLEAVEETALSFPEMYATATTTTPAVVSFLTGLYSEKNGAVSLGEVDIPDTVTTLAEVLKANGYGTHAFMTGPLIAERGLDRGFDTFRYRHFRRDLFTEWQDELAGTLDAILDREGDQFVYIHLWELHGKEDGSLEYPSSFERKVYGDTSYARALSALDEHLKNVLEVIPDDTAIVITGDHGESITFRDSRLQTWLKRGRTLLRYHLGIDTRRVETWLNHRFEGRYPKIEDHFIEEEHGETPYDFAANVPFLIRAPDMDAGECEHQVRQVDIFPTILSLAGIEEDLPYQLDGDPLLPVDTIEDRACYLRACGAGLKGRKNWIRGIRKEGWKYLEFLERDWPPELYNLDADPREMHTVHDEHPNVVESLQEALPSGELKRQDESEAIKEKLRELGYT